MSHSKRSRHTCNDPICKMLNRYVGQNVIIRTVSGDVIEGTLNNVTSKCLVEVTETAIVSPITEGRLTVIRCSQIESFSVIQ